MVADYRWTISFSKDHWPTAQAERPSEAAWNRNQGRTRGGRSRWNMSWSLARNPDLAWHEISVFDVTGRRGLGTEGYHSAQNEGGDESILDLPGMVQKGNL